MSVIDDWLAGRPKATRSTYSRAVAGFLAHSKHDLLHATQDDVLAWHARLIEQSPSTVKLKLSALSSFYAYMRKRGLRDDDPMVAIARRPKVQALGKARWLDLKEQRTVLGAVESDRDTALVWLLAHGLRISEVVNLDIENIQHGVLRFDGKGGKTRSVPLVLAAQNALAAYIGNRKSGPVLLGPNGRLAVRTAQRIVGEITLRSLGKRMPPHSFRHGFVTRMLRAGVGLAQVSMLAGHSDAGTTQLYSHLDSSDLEQAMGSDPLNETGELIVIDGGKERQAV